MFWVFFLFLRLESCTYLVGREAGRDAVSPRTRSRARAVIYLVRLRLFLLLLGRVFGCRHRPGATVTVSQPQSPGNDIQNPVGAII